MRKNVEQKLRIQEKQSKLRRRNRLITKLTTANRLGTTKFEPMEQPFTPSEELAGSLREVRVSALLEIVYEGATNILT